MDSKSVGKKKTFEFGTEINVALGQLAANTRKKETVLILEALAATYPEIREVIYAKRGWS